MKYLPSLIAFLFIFSAALSASAQVPKKQPGSRYTSMWKDSLFTSKPPPPDKQEDKTFEDWTLVGVAKTPTGPRVTLLNKKDRTKRITISDGKSVQGFEVVSVNMSRNYKESTVKVRSSGGKVGEIGVDLKVSSLKKAAPRAGAKPKRGAQKKQNTRRNITPPIPNANSRNKNNNSNNKKTKKRPRIVRPRK